MKGKFERTQQGLMYQPNPDGDWDVNFARYQDSNGTVHLVAVNPGTGPIQNTSADTASANMKQFIRDSHALIRDDLVCHRDPSLDDGEGRYGYQVIYAPSGKSIPVLMPGLPLERVRYMGDPGQDIWDYPRLYVNGMSWIWKYALLDQPAFATDYPEK